MGLGIDSASALECASVDAMDERVQISHRAAVADVRPFNVERDCLNVDASGVTG